MQNSISRARDRRHFEGMLQQHGQAAVRRARRSLEKQMRIHAEKLDAARRPGGFTSSMEREVRNFQRQIAVIDEILGEEQ